jgi:hypothetical protein
VNVTVSPKQPTVSPQRGGDAALFPAFVAFREGTPDALPEWVRRFVEALAAFAGEAAAAQAAGIPLRTARILRATSPRFDEECEEALEYRADKLAHELPGSARPVGSIVELKRHRPAQYVERNINLNVNADAIGAPPDAAATLARMIASTSPDEWRAMRGEVIDFAPYALPPGPDAA